MVEDKYDTFFTRFAGVLPKMILFLLFKTVDSFLRILLISVCENFLVYQKLG